MRSKFCRRSTLALLVLAVAKPSLAAKPSEDWPTFRGSNRTAVSPDTGLLQQWPAEGPPLELKFVGAGRGYSSIAIAGNHVITLGDGLSTAPDKDEYLSCFDRKTGKQLWIHKTGAPWTDGQPAWQSSRSTPTIDGPMVYVVTPQGMLVACETESGDEKWRKDLKGEFHGNKADGWGYSESVLIDGDHLICTPGGGEDTMVALNKKTGDLVWATKRDDDRGAGHASIVPSEVGGTKVYVQTTGSGALGVRASDGKLMWSYPIDKTTAVIPTPIVKGDLVFFTAGYGRGGALLKQVPAGNGEVKMEEVYGLKKELGNKHGGVILVGDYLYGDTDDRGTPFCADLMTGEIKWKDHGSGKNSASMAAADGRLYILFASGQMVLAKADPKAYEEVGSFAIPGSGERPSWAHPVIVDGRLYVREQDTILCYDVRDQGSAATK